MQAVFIFHILVLFLFRAPFRFSSSARTFPQLVLNRSLRGFLSLAGQVSGFVGFSTVSHIG